MFSIFIESAIEKGKVLIEQSGKVVNIFQFRKLSQFRKHGKFRVQLDFIRAHYTFPLRTFVTRNRLVIKAQTARTIFTTQRRRFSFNFVMSYISFENKSDGKLSKHSYSESNLFSKCIDSWHNYHWFTYSDTTFDFSFLFTSRQCDASETNPSILNNAKMCLFMFWCVEWNSNAAAKLIASESSQTILWNNGEDGNLI